MSRRLARPVWVVPRAVLDARLVAHATRAGAMLRRQRARSFEVHADGVLVDGVVHGRVLVGADGAHSVVRPAVGLRPARRRALAIRGYAPTPPDRRGSAGHRLRAPPPAVVRLGLRPRRRTVQRRVRRAARRRRTPPSRSLLLGAARRSSAGCRVERDRLARPPPAALGLALAAAGRGRVLLAGDAAGLVNPMTGEGIYYAVATGHLAGRAAALALAAGDAAPRGGACTAPRCAGCSAGTSALQPGLAAVPVPAVVDAGIRTRRPRPARLRRTGRAGLGPGAAHRPLTAGLARGLLTGHEPHRRPPDRPVRPGDRRPRERRAAMEILSVRGRAARAPLPPGARSPRRSPSVHRRRQPRPSALLRRIHANAGVEHAAPRAAARAVRRARRTSAQANDAFIERRRRARRAGRRRRARGRRADARPTST